MKKFLAAFVLPLAFVCSTAFAAQFKKGDKELGFGLEFTSGKDLKNTDFSVDFGYHFTPENQGTVLIDYKKLEVAGLSATGGFFGFAYDRNLLGIKKDLVPHFGGGFKIPLSDYKDVYSNVMFIHGGAKYFFTSSVLIRMSLAIERYKGANNFDDSTSVALRAGYVIKFADLGLSKKTSRGKVKAKSSSGKKKSTTKKKSRRKRKTAR